jgi:uncharacterized protein YqeY
MSLRSDIDARYVTAMKAKDAPAVSAFRMLRAAIKNIEIDKQIQLNDEQTLDVVGKEVKKLKDAMADFEKAGRQDLVDQTKAELALISGFMPAQMSDEEVAAAVAKKASELGLSGEAAFGRLMGEMMKELKGRADGGAVGKAVKEFLSKP